MILYLMLVSTPDLGVGKKVVVCTIFLSVYNTTPGVPTSWLTCLLFVMLLRQSCSVQFVNIVPYARWYPSVHYSSLVVWVLSLFTLWIAAYESAKEYRTR